MKRTNAGVSACEAGVQNSVRNVIFGNLFFKTYFNFVDTNR